MTSRLHQRLSALERQSDLPPDWRSIAAEQADELADAVLLAIVRKAMGWPVGYMPSDDELLAVVEGRLA